MMVSLISRDIQSDAPTLSGHDMEGKAWLWLLHG